MALEPVRPIERSLRKAARKRREQAAKVFELHPIDRRMLQVEVAQIRARFGKRSFLHVLRFPGLLPRLAWSMGILVVLACAVWSLLPPSRTVGPLAFDSVAKPDPLVVGRPTRDSSETAALEKQLTGDSDTRTVERSVQASKDQVNGPAEALSLGGGMSPEPKEKSVKDNSLAMSDAPAAKARVETGSREGSRHRLNFAIPPTTLAPTQASPGAAPSASREMARTDKKSEQVAPTYYRQAIPLDQFKQASIGDTVLRSFTLRTSGAQVFIQDNDQSVYSGYAESADKLPATLEEKDKPAEARSFMGSSILSTTNLLTFRVVGTNLTTKEKVVFSGSLIPLLTTNSTGGSLSSGFRLDGSVAVGSRPAIKVQASPVPQ